MVAMIVIGFNHTWAERYNLYKHVETDYCIYLDTDCVVINDSVMNLLKSQRMIFWLHSTGGFLLS